jgi:hypothetical protein
MTTKLKIGDLATALAGILLLVSSLLHQIGRFDAYHELVVNVLVVTYLLGLVVAAVTVAASLGLLPERFPWRTWATAAALVVLLNAVFGAVAMSEILRDIAVLTNVSDPGLSAGVWLGVASAVVLFVSVAFRDVVPWLALPIGGASAPDATDEPLALSPGGPDPDVRFGVPWAPDPPRPVEPAEPAAAQTTAPPQMSEPATAQPAVARPEMSEPATAQPAVARPEMSEPETVQPAVARPAVARPEMSEPAMSEPAMAQPEIATTPVTSSAAEALRAETLAAPVPVAAPLPPPVAFMPFWAAVPTPRPIYGTEDPNLVVAVLQPGVWYAAVAPHSHGLVVQVPTGETGVLVQVADLFRG